MIKDVTLFPDQDQIQMDVARAPYRSKIDLSNAYKQVRVELDDVHKTAFATVYGTHESNVLQQGNCNGPATFQRLVTIIFCDAIGIHVHVYLDNLFIYSFTLEDHDQDLEYVLQKLRKNCLFIETGKCDLYSMSMDCLGHRIDDHGLHADTDKMACICEWRMPRNLKDVQRFLGLVTYLAHFMPDVTAYTGPISAICRNGQPFYWKPLHETCFNHIKAIACKSLILKPINSELANPIWVICDASMSGVGAMYGQGETWQNCRPAGFMSKKFTAAQINYHVFEMETIAILKALLKWEDKLLGRRLLVVTDHKALEFFKMQKRLSSRQAQWMEFLAHFDYDITYVKGKTNLVADALSRYYENDEWDKSPDGSLYVNANIWLDPEGEDLPWACFEKNRVMWATEEAPHTNSCPQRQQCVPCQADKPVSFAIKRPVTEVMEARQRKAKELATYKECGGEPPVIKQPPPNDQDDPKVGESMGHFPDLHP